jgi:sulfur carrier protein
MKVMINGMPREMSEGASVDAAVAMISRAATGLAVAVNGEVVRRAAWTDTRLAAGDHVEVVTAVQGG